jgi:hypothetical protein
MASEVLVREWVVVLGEKGGKELAPMDVPADDEPQAIDRAVARVKERSGDTYAGSLEVRSVVPIE